MNIRVQAEDFDIGAEIAALKCADTRIGAICSFVGTVRDLAGQSDTSLTLEHYPGMTHTALKNIYTDAMQRFGLLGATICHRIGPLSAGDNIVLVIAVSAHRQAAFDGASYLMDRLKTDAPFWKLEGDHWVQDRASDKTARDAWDKA